MSESFCFSGHECSFDYLVENILLNVRKEVRNSLKMFTGHVQCSFDFSRQFFACIFCLFSNSVLFFSLQFIDDPPDIFTVVIIHNRFGLDNKGSGSNPTTARLLNAFRVINFYEEMFLFILQSFLVAYNINVYIL